MAIRKAKRNAGISRIDQREKRTHGFFVRLSRKGKLRSAFFADKSHGGKRNALKAAQKHYRKLLRKYGRMSRRAWAQIERRKSRSGVTGVREAVVKRGRRKLAYWMATWSPSPYVVRRKLFSTLKYGWKKARGFAMKARRAGVRNMKD